MTREPLIVAKDLDMGYGDFVLMQDLNFTVSRGDISLSWGKRLRQEHSAQDSRRTQEADAGGGFLRDVNFWKIDSGQREQMMKRFGILYQSGALWSSMTLGENIGLPLHHYMRLSPARYERLPL